MTSASLQSLAKKQLLDLEDKAFEINEKVKQIEKIQSVINELAKRQYKIKRQIDGLIELDKELIYYLKKVSF